MRRHGCRRTRRSDAITSRARSPSRRHTASGWCRPRRRPCSASCRPARTSPPTRPATTRPRTWSRGPSRNRPWRSPPPRRPPLRRKSSPRRRRSTCTSRTAPRHATREPPPVHRGDPGYARHLDRDGDGVGCE
uniref:excalibur calcium-binding domain-containing protein n=1 Tax=Microbacterium faecale TaxID=1804630 RepID=UPI001E2DEF5A|nr:excalibur calcium-binding domain-containing protein [Microbacterium faecale]